MVGQHERCMLLFPHTYVRARAKHVYSWKIKMDGTKVALIAKLAEHEKNTSKNMNNPFENRLRRVVDSKYCPHTG